MAKQYFRKELLTNAVILRGKPVAFEALDGNRGLLALEENSANDYLIEGLNDRATRHVQGIVKITEQEYEDLKKNLQSSMPSVRQKEYLRTMAQPSPGRKKEAASPNPVPPVSPAPAPPPPAIPATPAPVAQTEPEQPAFRAPTAQQLGEKHFPATEPASPSLPNTPETTAPDAGSKPAFVPTMAPLQEVQAKADENLKAAQKDQQQQTIPKPPVKK